MRKSLVILIAICILGALATGLLISLLPPNAQKHASERLVGSILSDAPPRHIDAVVSWVDGSDPVWKMKKSMYDHMYTEASAMDNTAMRFGMEEGSDVDELWYCLSCIRKHAPWVRKIYVLMDDCQAPKYSLDKFGAIRMPHSAFIQAGSLPVFNSHAIEANLHRVPGLSEHFVYFNDDCYIRRPVLPSDFFGGDRPILRVRKSLDHRHYKKGTRAHAGAALNSLAALRDRFGQQTLGVVHIHHAVPLTKTMMRAAEADYSGIWSRTSSSTFRSRDDVIPIPLALSHALYSNPTSLAPPPSPDTIKHVFWIGDVSKALTKKTKSIDPHFLCINGLKDPTGIDQYPRLLNLTS